MTHDKKRPVHIFVKLEFAASAAVCSSVAGVLFALAALPISILIFAVIAPEYAAHKDAFQRAASWLTAGVVLAAYGIGSVIGFCCCCFRYLRIRFEDEGRMYAKLIRQAYRRYPPGGVEAGIKRERRIAIFWNPIAMPFTTVCWYLRIALWNWLTALLFGAITGLVSSIWWGNVLGQTVGMAFVFLAAWAIFTRFGNKQPFWERLRTAYA